ncbi:MAG: hypothetical protein D6702_00330 [Planctomycetota bacterium]|nr:MAG: hypothetical protein D6702_00330 [Planctomycetota bacterium]
MPHPMPRSSRLLRPLLAAACGLAPLLLPACGGLTAEEEQLLEDFRARATQYYDANDLGRAEQQALRGLQIDPDHPVLNHIMGRTLLKYQDARHVAAARKYLEKAYELDPQYKTAYSLGECRLRLAEFRVARAVALDERAAELGPDEVEARAELADRAERLRADSVEDLAAAEKYLGIALEADPSNVWALRLLANTYAHQDRPEDALHALERLIEELRASRRWKNERLALEALPLVEEQSLRQRVREDIEMEIEARGLAAAIHKAAQRYAESAEQLSEILKLDPSRVQEYYNRGLCRYWLGDLAGAHADMREFLRRTDLEFGAEEVERALNIVSEYERTRAGAAAGLNPVDGAGDRTGRD